MSKLAEIKIAKGSLAALFLSQSLLLGGCDAPTEVDEVIADSDEVANGDGEEDQFRAWTGYTSEEYPPLTCPYGEVVQGADCRGDYCDNTSLYCAPTGRATGWSTWTPYFSEEGAAQGQCNYSDMWMTGMACRGSYCDNVTLMCSQVVGSWTGECGWTGWYSEEQGPFNGYQGYFIKGIQCSGHYCDNKRYYYCAML